MSPLSQMWFSRLSDYTAGSRLGFETNVVHAAPGLAVKLDSHGSDSSLPLRPWWTP